MRMEAQRSLLLQDCLPADDALRGYHREVSGEALNKALRDWEKRRGIIPWHEQKKAAQKAYHARKQAEKPKKQPKPKLSKEEQLNRKLQRAREKYATNLEFRQKELERNRINRAKRNAASINKGTVQTVELSPDNGQLASA